MLKYILKRIFIFIPTLLVISLLIFGLSKIAPGDPVELRMAGGLQAGDSGLDSKRAGEEAYLEIARDMGLHLPVFYADFTSQAYPDTMYKVGRRYEKTMLGRLCSKFGNWPEISKYYKSLKAFEESSYDTILRNDNTYDQLRNARETANELYREYNEEVIVTKLNNIKNSINQPQTYEEVTVNENGESDTTTITKNLFQPLIAEFDGVIGNFNAVQQNAKPFNKYIPKVTWHGLKNQYHRWLFGDIPWFRKSDDPTLSSKGFFRGDFGISLRDGRPVWSKVKEGLAITITMNFIALFLIYAISIPMGVYIAVKRDSFFDRFSTTLLFILYSLPSFWIATMLLVFFTNSEYGMDFFPSFGLGFDKIAPDASFFSKLKTLSYHAFLPILCMTYGSLAFLSRQMRGGVINVFNQDYIRTARAKGLPESKVIWKHTFRNSLIPIITIFAAIFPAMIGGALIIEIIFSIPGMGNIAFDALLSRDWPVLFTVVILSSILTLVGILISDILYSVADPRITFTKKA